MTPRLFFAICPFPIIPPAIPDVAAVVPRLDNRAKIEFIVAHDVIHQLIANPLPKMVSSSASSIIAPSTSWAFSLMLIDARNGPAINCAIYDTWKADRRSLKSLENVPIASGNCILRQ
jgi:hypothetical protein